MKVTSSDRLPNVNASREAADTAGAASTASATLDDQAKQALHAKPITLDTTYVFNKIKAEDSALSLPTRKILDRFQINANANKYDNAVMSKDGNTLVIVNRGEVGLKQLFGGRNALTRTMYKVFGWVPRLFGAAHKAIAANRYKELFNAADIEEQGEPLKHVLAALKKSEYHTVTVFHKDEKTGELTKDPVSIAIIDAYANVIDTHIRRKMQEKNLSEEEITNEIKAKKDKYGSFKKYYSLDKLIPISKLSEDLKDIMHQVIEGLYAAQGFDAFVIPSQVHPQVNVNSNDLNYAELDWHYIKQKPDGKWNIVGDAKLLDDFEFKSPENKEDYLKIMTQTQYSPKLTVVRPIDKAKEAISPFLSDLQQWSTMSQGSELRTSDPEDLKLLEITEPVNRQSIEKYNATAA